MAAARPEVGLTLVLRDGRTTWTFAPPVVPPPSESMCTDLRNLRETCLQLLRSVRGSSVTRPWWWVNDGALDVIAEQLTTRNFCVIDGLCGPLLCDALLSEVINCDAIGALQISELRGGLVSPSVRGDRMAWLDANGVLKQWTQAVDTLVAELKPRVPDLGGITERSPPHCAKYPGGGACYVRHCDNTCSNGHGASCNGRRLTIVYYVNTCEHGGELRLWPDANLIATDYQPVADVRAIADRAVLFYADSRVPHEVLPTHADRYALTAWYLDQEERLDAHSRK